MRGSHPFSQPIPPEFGSRPYSGEAGLRECVRQPPQTRYVTVDHRASSASKMTYIVSSGALNSTHSLPELYPYCYSSYCKPSFLYFGQHTILSQEGLQQGDPLGPLLFCDTIQTLLTSLESELTLGYLDDVTLGGPQDVILDIQRITTEGGDRGLHLNPSKCEVVTHPSLTDPTLQSFKQVEVQDATLLGAPLFQGSVLDSTWDDRCADLTRAAVRLRSINAQDALILLRVSFSATRVQHLLRCSPSVDHAPSTQNIR